MEDQVYKSALPDLDGPSWKWIVGILVTVVGLCLSAWMSVIWSQVSSANMELARVNVTLATISQQLNDQTQQMTKLWSLYDTDHTLLTEDHFTVSVDHDWIAAQVEASRAVRALHKRR